MKNQTIEGNKLIAEFMGYIDNGCSDEGFLINPETNHDEDISELKYHSSWDWLMPVVDKIESLGVSFTIKTSWNHFHDRTFTQVSVLKEVGEMSQDRKCMFNFVEVYKKHSKTSNSKIEEVYESVVDFITWYNSI